MGDAQNFLKVLVQDIEKTIGEAPEEEEDCNQANWYDGLAGGDLGGTSDLLVVNTFPILFAPFDRLNGRGTTLVVDVFDDRLCSLPRHVG